jgi:RNA polymerase sigma-70 factor (ECF subfamily)
MSTPKAATENREGRDSIPTRRSLLTRLKRWDNDRSWQEFFDTYWRLIYGVARRAGLDEGDAEDVVQETIVSVAKQMPNFKYDPQVGSFKSWLFLITQRRITDSLRRQYRRVPTESSASDKTDETALVERIPDPAGQKLDEVWEEEWKRQLLETAIARVKRQVDPKHFQIFDCYVRKEWPVKDVVAAFGVNAGQVYLIKHRVSALLARELRNTEMPPGSGDTGEPQQREREDEGRSP